MNETRLLTEEEGILLKHLLHLANDKRANDPLPTEILAMDDGLMGSIQFGQRCDRVYSKEIVQVEYLDIDNVPVFITIIEDQFGDLFEIEFWKVDFSRLLRYPKPELVKIVPPTIN